ncbi:MAG: NAD(P)H-hydrate dehydratase [candidate division WOR-3 bacterium]
MFSIYGETSKKIDTVCFEKYLIKPEILMENAAIASCNTLLSNFKFERPVIVCSTGNNGGDGFALARHLLNKNYDVSTIVLGDTKKLSDESQTNLKILMKLSRNILFNPSENKFSNILKSSDLIVDALFGTGFHGEFTPFFRKYVKIINRSNKRIFSLDIPSGLDSNTGMFDRDTVKATATITFGFVKTGMLWVDSKKFTGDIFVADISIPYQIVFDYDFQTIIEKDIIVGLVKHFNIKKEKYFHKRQKGNLFLIGGNKGMEGSIQIAALGAMKTGAGIVYIKQLGNEKIKFLKEAVYIDNFDDGILKSENIVIGCGFGNDQNSKETFIEMIKKLDHKKVIIDADGINIIAQLDEKNKKRILKNKIITPHPEEFFRLTKKRFSNIKEKITLAEEFSKKYSTVTVLKSPPTVVTDGENTFVLPNSNLKLATAGSGDLLAGMIGAYVSFGYDLLTSSVLGVYTHFRSGEISKSKNPLISEIAQNIGEVQNEIFL